MNTADRDDVTVSSHMPNTNIGRMPSSGHASAVIGIPLDESADDDDVDQRGHADGRQRQKQPQPAVHSPMIRLARDSRQGVAPISRGGHPPLLGAA